jgi:hypothetical protein
MKKHLRGSSNLTTLLQPQFNGCTQLKISGRHYWPIANGKKILWRNAAYVTAA